MKINGKHKIESPHPPVRRRNQRIVFWNDQDREFLYHPYFFDNKQRLQKLKETVESNNTDLDLDRKMIAVVLKADHPEWFNMVCTLFHGFTLGENGNDPDLNSPPDAWLQVEKFELDCPFWRVAKTLFGYTEEVPNLKNFLVRLLVTDFAHHFRSIVPDSLAHLVLPSSGNANAVVCLAQWRDSASKGSSDDRPSDFRYHQCCTAAN